MLLVLVVGNVGVGCWWLVLLMGVVVVVGCCCCCLWVFLVGVASG